jgi:hypothetical protein
LLSSGLAPSLPPGCGPVGGIGASALAKAAGIEKTLNIIRLAV